MRTQINKIIAFVFASLFFSFAASAQVPYSEEQFRAFDGKGNPVTIDQIVKAIGETDVVFLGEQHDDGVGHAVQAEIFKRTVEQYGAKRRVALSLEMFERDNQIVLNEYLNGQITEAHFMSSSRPWPNYKTDYRPLVELAKEKRLSVIAANAPRRYINMVSRNGRDALNSLTKPAKEWIAPLPYGEPSATYAAKFKALMGPSPEAQMGIDKILASQSLWDATMANSVAKYLKSNKGSLVVHLNGAFHTESRLGTVEHLLKYRRKAKVLVVTMRYVEDFKTFDKAKFTDLGDFVILTMPKKKTAGVMTQILDRMSKHYKAITSLRADVTMIKTDAILKESDTFSGQVSYLPPSTASKHYVRIDWIKPVSEQIVIIGDDYLLYRPKLNMAIRGSWKNSSANKALDGALAFMSMSKEQLKANYDLKFVGEEKISDGVNTLRLEIKPNVRTIYKTAEAWVDSDGMPRQVKVTEHNGDITSVMLSKISKNVPIDSSIFRLNLPKNVRVIRG